MAVQATPKPKVAPKAATLTDRLERYDVVGPDGLTVTVEHNLDTGETSVR